MESDPQARLEVLKAERRQEILESFDVFQNAGESETVLSVPAWRRPAVLEREALLREKSC